MKGNRKWKQLEPPTHRWNIVRGDLVQVIQGPQAGQQGKIIRVIRPLNRVIVEGVNMVRSTRGYLMFCFSLAVVIVLEAKKH